MGQEKSSSSRRDKHLAAVDTSAMYLLYPSSSRIGGTASMYLPLNQTEQSSTIRVLYKRYVWSVRDRDFRTVLAREGQHSLRSVPLTYTPQGFQ